MGRAESTICLALVLIFSGVSALTLMNLIVGVLCEVIHQTSMTEKKELAASTLTRRLRHVAHDLDQDFDGFISLPEFENIIEMPEALQALEEVDIDPMELLDLAEVMFWTPDRDRVGKPKSMSFETFMDNLLELRHCQWARLRDVRNIWAQVDPATRDMKQSLSKVNTKFDAIEQGITDVMKEV